MSNTAILIVVLIFIATNVSSFIIAYGKGKLEASTENITSLVNMIGGNIILTHLAKQLISKLSSTESKEILINVLSNTRDYLMVEQLIDEDTDIDLEIDKFLILDSRWTVEDINEMKERVK